MTRDGAEHPILSGCEKLADEDRLVTGFAALMVAAGTLSSRSSDGERFRLVAGDVLTVGLRARCAVKPLATPCEILILEAEPAWTEATLCHGRASQLLSERVAVHRATGLTARRARQILRSLVLPAAGSGSAGGLRAAAAAAELMALALEGPADGVPAAAASQAGAESRSAFTAAVSALCGDESLEDLSLGLLAAKLGLSERQVSRLFRLELGTTFTSFVTELRVQRARRLLAGSALPIIGIAAETGWSSLAHFNAVFRRHTGRTPSAYRAHVRSAEEPSRPAIYDDAQ